LGTREFLCCTLILTASSFIISATPAKAQEPLSAQRLTAAREELVALLQARPRAELETLKYIMPGERVEDARLGKPYAVYRIESDKVRNLIDYRLFKTCLTFCEWEIPVSFGNQSRMVLGQYWSDGEWKFASYGRDPSPIDDARSRWPESDGYRLSYIFQTTGPAFIMIERKGNTWLYSLMERNERLLGITKDAFGRYPLLDVSTVVKKLKAAPEMHFDPKME
jgi:hypothetical protein